MFEADAMQRAGMGRAVAARAEVWRGGAEPSRAEAAGRGPQAAGGGAGGVRRHPRSVFDHRRAGPAGRRAKVTGYYGSGGLHVARCFIVIDMHSVTHYTL